MAKPNIILLVTDDMRAPTPATMDDLSAMGSTQEILGTTGSPATGVRYTRCTAANPLCAPDRASILTGQHSKTHGVWNNDPHDGQGINALHPLESNLLPMWLQAAGYDTSFVGKYCNGYGEDGDNKPATFVPPGWDDWRATQDHTYIYNGTRTLNVNGNILSNSEYVTTWAKNKAVDRINAWAPRPAPFFLMVSFVACHNQDPGAEPKYEGDSTVGHSESDCYDEAKPDDVPWVADNVPVNGPELTDERRKRRDVLRSVDDAVVAIRNALVQNGVMDDTLIIFVSDNGFLLGEHRIRGKSWPYEESVKVPLLARWTHGPLTPGITAQQVSTVDITATICDAAEATPGRTLEGRSLFDAPPPPGVFRPVFSEGRPSGRPDWTSVRVGDYKLVNHAGSPVREFYDLDLAPWERTNHISMPEYADTIASMQTLLDQRNGTGYDYATNWTPPA